MKTRMILCNIMMLAAAAIMSSCEMEDPETKNNDRVDIPLTKVQEQIGYSANTFTFDFLKALYLKEDEGKNIFVSPFSIQMVLAMTAQGSEGETRSEMYKALGFEDYSKEELSEFYNMLIPALQGVDNTTTFEIANSFWAKNAIKIKDSYTSDIKKNFCAEVRTLPDDGIAAAGEINSWCDKATHGMINKIVDEINPDIMVSLLNAIYFKGIWSDPFKKERNTEENFSNWDGNKVKTTYMNKTFDDARVYSDEYVEAMSLPYGNEAFAMTLVVPREGVAMNTVLDKLDPETWANYRDGGEWYETVFKMPKFDQEYQAGKVCIEILNDLGMKLAFTPSADFSAMSKTGLMISQIFHKAKIKIDEEGTEAAAVTYVGMECTSVGPGFDRKFYFNADKPFLYFISERSTGEILFAGIKNSI